jgi:hypothetical protein
VAYTLGGWNVSMTFPRYELKFAARKGFSPASEKKVLPKSEELLHYSG